MILAGKDHIYGPMVRQLRLLGIPTWLIVPGRHVAAPLLSGSCAVTYLGPGAPALAIGSQSEPSPVPYAFSSERKS